MDSLKDYLQYDELMYYQAKPENHRGSLFVMRLADERRDKEHLAKALQSIIDYEEDNYGELEYFKTIDAMKDIARKALGYQKESEK